MSGHWTNGVSGEWFDSFPGQDRAAVCSAGATGRRPEQSVSPHGVPDPLQVAADFGVDTRFGGGVTWDVTPGHNAL